jgi:polar amino acid transport system substrate-binding protein
MTIKKWFIGIVSLLSFFFINNAFGDQIVLVADEWCPYNCNPDSEKRGYMVDLAVQILGEAGHSVKYKTINWSRSIAKTREGKYHGIIGASKKEAPDFIFPKDNLGLASNHYWVKKGDQWRFSGIKSLKNRWLGVIQDYDYGNELNKYIKKNLGTFAVQERAGDDALDVLINKLEHGRINTLNEDQNVFLYKVTTLGKIDLFEDAGHDLTPIEANLIYIAFSPYFKESKDYANILNEGVIRYRNNGKLRKIMSTYGLTDWK